MKYIVLILLNLVYIQSVFATECSKYIEKTYEQTCNGTAHITVKKEHIDNCYQYIGKHKISAIVFGYGDLKTKDCKKMRISYICLLDKNCKPLWGHIIPR